MVAKEFYNEEQEAWERARLQAERSGRPALVALLSSGSAWVVQGEESLLVMAEEPFPRLHLSLPAMANLTNRGSTCLLRRGPVPALGRVYEPRSAAYFALRGLSGRLLARVVALEEADEGVWVHLYAVRWGDGPWWG
ncbi:hypothetical protein [Thermus brevis]|uniref:hypothetical protein n=1 Tax=Thermus brevis TaxID=2862456 RepID=UPI001CA5F1FD|nr:hypothetical protein [Thermus brevis]